MQTVLKSILINSILAAVLVGVAPRAEAADLKIAYVDMARALNDVEDGKAAKNRLKRDFDAKQKRLDKLQNELKKKKEEFERKAGTMKADIRMKKQEELQAEFLRLQQTYMQLQQELMASEQQATAQIADKLRKVVERIGDREAYFMILNIGDTVLYHKRHMDVTDQVVKEYNKQYGKK